jgi:hypothetical protein
MAARAYDRDFECTEIDGDVATLLWDAAAGTGTFGWQPAAAGAEIGFI